MITGFITRCLPVAYTRRMLTLERGRFFGRAVAAARCGEFTMAETRFARGAFLPWHTHAEGYLTFVLAGGYHERLRTSTRACAARSVVLHPAGDTHEDDFGEQSARCLNVVLAPAFAKRVGEREGVVASEEIAGIGRRLSAELTRNDDASALIVEGLLLELFGMLSRQETASSRVPAWLREVHAIVTRDFARKLSLEELAGSVGIHPVHLARAFRKHFGTSVGERVRALRIAHVRERIAAGAPLARIAAEAGFADQSHLTRAFQREVGMSPSAYQRSARTKTLRGDKIPHDTAS
jgi:AraC family transcriptional regulator